MTCSSIYGDGNSMWILHFVYIGHEFITSNLVPRAFSSKIFKMADRHFENCRGEGPGDVVPLVISNL